MTCGIYAIENKVTGRIYVGQSLNTTKRICHHKHCLRKNKHDNDFLQKAWNKYGEDVFVSYVLEECTKENLLAVEQKWVMQLKSMKRENGYNLIFPQEILTPTEETRKKLSLAGKGKASPMKGKKHREESKQKVRDSLKDNSRRKGISHSKETKANMSKDRRKLTDAEVLEIFFRSHLGENRNPIAEEFKIEPQLVSRIKMKRYYYEKFFERSLFSEASLKEAEMKTLQHYPEMKALAPSITGLVRCDLRPDKKEVRITI